MGARKFSTAKGQTHASNFKARVSFVNTVFRTGQKGANYPQQHHHQSKVSNHTNSKNAYDYYNSVINSTGSVSSLMNLNQQNVTIARYHQNMHGEQNSSAYSSQQQDYQRRKNSHLLNATQGFANSHRTAKVGVSVSLMQVKNQHEHNSIMTENGMNSSNQTYDSQLSNNVGSDFIKKLFW